LWLLRPLHARVRARYPGDLLYVPRGWSHSTVNIAETIGIAVEIDGSSCDKHRCAAQLV